MFGVSGNFLVLYQLENGLDLAREMIKCYNEGKINVSDESIGKDFLNSCIMKV